MGLFCTFWRGKYAVDGEKIVILELIMDKLVYDNSFLRAHATRLGVIVGVYWSGSFLCNMYGASMPLLGLLAMPLGLLCMFRIGGILGRMMAVTEGLTRRRAWRLCLVGHLLGILLVTLLQYVYFRYLDDGMLMRSMMETLELPEMKELLKNFPDEARDQMMEIMSNPALMTRQLFFYNIFLALVVSVPTAAWGWYRARLWGREQR